MIQLDADQERAVVFALSADFCVINGGAGTGKTTIIDELTRRLTNQGETVRLCAFAGKAAARLKEVTKREASTIHRLLGSNGISFLAGDLIGITVIIDEASMVSSDLLAEICKRKPKRLILVGDEAQLPPVGKGQPFHDLINLRPDAVANLKTCYRATEAVYQAATAIRNGQMPEIHSATASEKWDIIQTGNGRLTEKAILEWVKSGHIDFDNDILLCPRNGGDKNAPPDSTVASLNEEIVKLVNPRSTDEKICAGDRVINTKNFAEENVWNGTTGKVLSVDVDGSAWVRLDVPIQDKARSGQDDSGNPFYTDTVLFTREMKKHLQLAYALTVHKSQGSQYRRVIFIALDRDCHMLLDRPLLYTAVTRTKEQCVVAGQISAVQKAIQTYRAKRTVIQELAGLEVNNE